VSPWRVGVVSGMASYIDAAAITGFSGAIVIFQTTLRFDAVEIGVAAGTLTGGIALGAVTGGRLGDRFGRKPVFTVTMATILIGAIALMFAPSFAIVLIGAALVGLGAGADLPVSLATIAEAADDRNRGRILGLSQILWVAGIIVNGVITALVANLGRLGTAIIFGHLAVVALGTLIARVSIPESTSWTSARRERVEGIPTVRAHRAGVRELVRSPYAVPFVALIVFYSLTNLASNSVGQFGSYVAVNYGGISLSLATVAGLPIVPVAIVCSLVFMRIADRPVRFAYFRVGAALEIVSPLFYVVFGVQLWTLIASGLVTAVGAAFAFEAIMKIWTQSSFPTLLRTTAQGTIIGVARLVAALFAVVTPILLQAVGVRVVWGVLSLLCAVGVTWAWAVFRTRDRHSEFDTEAALVADAVAETRGTPNSSR
jgi:inositol transporter-like SP family MFS transporter